jgi:arylsulfatase A-like enzyme
MPTQNRREFLGSFAATLAAEGTQPPNILFVMPDQWRGMDVGYAGNSELKTPALDRLAQEGVRFDSVAANCPVSTPARSILLTGRYPHATRMGVNDVPLPDEEVTIAEILRGRGYYTGFAGKWHLEGGKRLPGYVPPGERRQGFEFWAANICSHAYFDQQYFRDEPTPIKMNGYDAFTWTDLGIEFLEKARRQSKPFFLALWHPSPHDPYLEPPGFEGMYDPARLRLRKNWRPGAKRFGTAKDLAGYYAAISCLDREIGRLLERLDALGMRDNTIVVFTSDHGDMHGSHGMFLKRKPWEESVCVPGIIRWPAGLKGSWRTGVSFSHVDMLPTLLGLCGVRPPANIHGFDYSSYLKTRSGRTPEFAHLMIYTKSEADEFGPWRGLRSGKYKYARFREKPWLLHDLETDPYEMENLVDDPAQKRLIARLDGLIEAEMRRTADRWDELHDAPYT